VRDLCSELLERYKDDCTSVPEEPGQ
jgi:hypothetical protein